MKVLEFDPPSSPFSIIYADITHKCNMACTNCYVPNRNVPDMDLNNFTQLMAKLPKLTEIRLIGGEPTLKKNLPEFIKSVKKYNHRPVLVTNGLKLADFQYAQMLRQAGLDYVYISASGFDQDEIYKVTDNVACAEQKMAAIKNAESLGFEVGIGVLLMKNVNTHLISSIVNFALNLNVKSRVNFRNVGMIGRYTKNTDVYLSMNEMVSLVSKDLQIPSQNIGRFQKSPHQIYFPYKPTSGKSLRIKITDWQPEGFFIPDPDSLDRGRITPAFKVAPFFEHVKANEFGY